MSNSRLAHVRRTLSCSSAMSMPNSPTRSPHTAAFVWVIDIRREHLSPKTAFPEPSSQLDPPDPADRGGTIPLPMVGGDRSISRQASIPRNRLRIARCASHSPGSARPARAREQLNTPLRWGTASLTTRAVTRAAPRFAFPHGNTAPSTWRPQTSHRPVRVKPCFADRRSFALASAQASPEKPFQVGNGIAKAPPTR